MVALAETRNTLEDWSVWYKYKTQVWSEKSPQAAIVHNSMRLLRSIHNRDFIYVSNPVSSGLYLAKRVSDYKKEFGEPSKEAMAKIRDDAFAYNYNNGLEFLQQLKGTTDEPLMFAPDFSPTRLEYEQAHFMALWLSVMAEKCFQMRSGKEWDASNGCAEEFTHVMQLKLGIPKHRDLLFFNTKEKEEAARERMANMKVYDTTGAEITLERGYEQIKQNVATLKELGASTNKLEFCLDALEWTGDKLNSGFYQ